MIKLAIFDIDGVLVSTRKLHEIAFIKSLNQNGISITEEEHHKRFDGLPTKTKLSILGVSEDSSKKIFDLKQKLTFELADGHLKKNEEVKNIFNYLKANNIKTAICSNAIGDFCGLIVKHLQIEPDLILSNEDVSEPKPSSEIYVKSILHFNLSPRECLIFEDSQFGISSAYKSGANVCIIQNPSYLTLDKVQTYIKLFGG